MRLLLCAFLLLTACGRTGLDLGDGGADAGPTCTLVSDPAAELKRRWNLSVDTVSPGRDFRWVDTFPHPTYRGGDVVAYTDAADVLLDFWQAPGNLDFVRCEALLDRVWPSQLTKTVTLRGFTGELSTSTLVPASQRATLTQLCTTLGC